MPQIQRSTVPKTVRALVKDWESDKVRFDLPIQRNFVWGNDKKSYLIHSILFGIPIPTIYAIDYKDKNIWILDGNQRVSTIVSFVKDGFKLHKETPTVFDEEGNEVDIAGLKFSELSEEMQNEILNHNMSICRFENVEDDMRDELFYRLNNGMALNRIELTRVMASSKVMEFVDEVADEPFFAESIRLTNKARNRFGDQELILQIMMLAMNDYEPMDLGGTKVRNFAKSLKEEGVPEDIKEHIMNVTEYLNLAFTPNEKEPVLKKVSVPMVFYMANKAIDQEVEPSKFGGWVKDFLTDIKKGGRYSKETPYGEACQAGSAKKDKVKARMEAMEKDFEMYIKDAPNYIPTNQKTTLPEIDDNIEGLVIQAEDGDIIVMEDDTTEENNQKEVKEESNVIELNEVKEEATANAN